jgi:hypothetical protein
MASIDSFYRPLRSGHLIPLSAKREAAIVGTKEASAIASRRHEEMPG